MNSDATYTITGNKYMINDTGTITITVSLNGVADTTYKINYSRLDNEKISYLFDYTGNYQEFKVPFTGD